MAAEKKPRAVVLGKAAYDARFNHIEHGPLTFAGRGGLILYGVALIRPIGVPGTLLWLPDPPKQTKRGKR
jgi:hypothetical protein